jgi:uncharacterized protein YeeX (DUF496 family)
MDKKKLKTELEDLYHEIRELKEAMNHVSNSMQMLREELGRTSYKNTMLSMSKSYQHPWWKYQRK